MAHASGWGTRAGAYAGGSGGGSGGVDDLLTQLENTPTGPADLVDRAAPTGVIPTQRLASPTRTVLTDAPAPAPVVTPAVTRREVAAAPAAPVRRRRYNPLAAIPYAVALDLFALEALVYV